MCKYRCRYRLEVERPSTVTMHREDRTQRHGMRLRDVNLVRCMSLLLGSWLAWRGLRLRFLTGRLMPLNPERRPRTLVLTQRTRYATH